VNNKEVNQPVNSGGKMKKNSTLHTEETSQVRLQPQPRSLLTVKQFVQKHDFLSESALRSLIFRRESNGFSKVIRRINKKILIDESDFFSFIDEQSK